MSEVVINDKILRPKDENSTLFPEYKIVYDFDIREIRIRSCEGGKILGDKLKKTYIPATKHQICSQWFLSTDEHESFIKQYVLHCTANVNVPVNVQTHESALRKFQREMGYKTFYNSTMPQSYIPSSFKQRFIFCFFLFFFLIIIQILLYVF